MRATASGPEPTTSMPASSAEATASSASRATRYRDVNASRAPGTATTMPPKPHSRRSTSRSSQESVCTGTPALLATDGTTMAAPVRTAVSAAGSTVDRRVRSCTLLSRPTPTGTTNAIRSGPMRPDRPASPPCAPRTWAPVSDARRTLSAWSPGSPAGSVPGSSPPGSAPTAVLPRWPSAPNNPTARSADAAAAAMSSTPATSHVAAQPRVPGKRTPGSGPTATGSAGTSRIPGAHVGAGAGASGGSTAVQSCAAFSSRVIRPSASRTRRSQRGRAPSG